jgi:hypothetical protein
MPTADFHSLVGFKELCSLDPLWKLMYSEFSTQLICEVKIHYVAAQLLAECPTVLSKTENLAALKT